MAEKIASLYAEIYADTSKLEDGLGKTKSSLKDTDKSSKLLQDTFKTLKKTAGVMTGAVVAAGIAIKKGFDFTRAGAQVIQTEKAFSSMMSTIGVGTDVLKEWRSAVNGTISDMDLMTGFQTLAAGMSRELTQSFADNNAELLKISKAASALNPQLGDTAYMYESITRGIKRQSPLILDNLGIVVKVGEANEEMAKKLGKSVEELTAEEKQMGLLNAVLKSGDRLVTQLGGSVEAATDPYDRFTTAMKNNTDAIKRNAAEGKFIPNVLSNMADLADRGTSRLDLLNEAYNNGKISLREYEQESKRVAQTGKMTIRREEELTAAVEESRNELKLAALDAGYYSDMLEMAGKATGNLASTSEVALATVSDKYEAMASMMGQFSDTTDDLNEKQEDLTDLLTLQADQGYGYFDGQWLSASALKDKIVETQDEIDTLKSKMSSFANQAVLDMAWAAAAADGIITPKEFQDWVDLGVAVDEFSTEAADTLTEEFDRAFGVWQNIAFPDKFTNVFVKFHNMGGGYAPADTVSNVTINPGARGGSINLNPNAQTQALGGFYQTSSPTDFRTSETGQPETAIFVPNGKSIYDVASPSQISKVMPDGGGMGDTNNYYFNAVLQPDQIMQTIEQLKVLA